MKLKRIFISAVVLLVGVFAVCISFLSDAKSQRRYTTETLEDYYEVDNVFSTYSTSTQYTYNGGLYTNRNGLAIRSTTKDNKEAGVSLEVNRELKIDSDPDKTALVVDVNFYTNMARSYFVKLVLEDDSVVSTSSGNVYTAKNGMVADTYTTTGGSTYNNNLNPSSGRLGTNADNFAETKSYNQLVVPMSSFGYAGGEEISIKGILLYSPSWSTGSYNKYLIHSAGFTSNFQTESKFQVEELWNYSMDYALYGANSADIDVKEVEAGDLLMEPSLNASAVAVTQEFVFKFPDELIGEDGLVDTANIKGLSLVYNNSNESTSSVSLEGFFKLYDTTHLVSKITSNYGNFKAHKISITGNEMDHNVKYFYPADNNANGYANCITMLNFNSSSENIATQTASFHNPDGAMPEKISPYFTFNYKNSNTTTYENFNIGTLRVLTNDITVYQNSTNDPDHVSFDWPKGYKGNEVVFKAISGDDELESVKLNDVELTNEEITSLYSELGLKLTMTGDMRLNISYVNPLKREITYTEPENGELIISSENVLQGEKYLVRFKPKAGYTVDSFKVNNVEYGNNVKNNVIFMLAGEDDIDLAVTYKKATEFYLESGGMSSLYNSSPGSVFANFDAINLQTRKNYTESTDTDVTGLSLTGINVNVTAANYLVIQIHHITNLGRQYQIVLNDNVSLEEGDYFLVDRFYNVEKKNGSVIDTGTYLPTTNDKLTVASSEGFYGYIVIPMSRFLGVTTISKVDVRSTVKDKSYTRFNIGKMYLTDMFSSTAGYDAVESDCIYTPSNNNFSLYGSTEVSEAKFLKKGEIILETVNANSYGYDSFYWSFPQNMINENGFVDVGNLGIKGIAIDVKNYNNFQHSMALRVAGSESKDLATSSAGGSNLWQCSASTTPGKTIYNSGLVKTRNSAFIPFDDSGVFEGTLYIPFSETGFSHISVEGESTFPKELQPIIRVLPGTMNSKDYTQYKFEIGDIRFITDDSEFETHQITMNALNGIVGGSVEGALVTNQSNNNVLNNTEVTFTIQPDNGYKLLSARYTVNGENEQTINMTDNTFKIIATGDLMISIRFTEIDYKITYNLDGGTNSSENPESYTVEDAEIILKDPTKEGYTFVGWYNGDEKVTKIPSGSIGDISLIAKFEVVGGTPGGIEGWVIALIALGGTLLVAGAVTAAVLVRRKKGVK